MKEKVKIGSDFSVILVFVCLLIFGAFLLPGLPVKLNPTVDMPTVNIRYTMRNQSARVVEMEVTSKLEGALGRIEGIKKVNSLSSRGSGNITLQVDKGMDLNVVRFEVSTVIRQLYSSLPVGVSYPCIYVNKSNNDASRPFLSYVINAPVNPIEIKKYVESNIVQKLSTIEGIDAVEVYGAASKVWNLKYDYNNINEYGISTSEIKNAVSMYLHKEFLGLGNIDDSNNENSYVRLVLSPGYGKSFNINDITVKNRSGRIIKLSDVATAEYVQGRQSYYNRINGLNSISVYFTAKKNANQMDLAVVVKEKLSKLLDKAPNGYEFHKVYDATEYINTELNKIYYRSGLTVLILLLFVFVIYRSLRYLLMIIISLLCNLGCAVIFYHLCGIEIQIYSLVGITISLTLIIDNMIVMADQIVKRRNIKAFLAILAATLTTVASLVIIFFLPEKVRLNLQDFAIVLIINLTVSLFISLFLVPALISRMGILEGKHFSDKRVKFSSGRKRFAIKLVKVYKSFIFWFSRRRWLAVVIVVFVFGLPVFLLPSKLGSNENNYNHNQKEKLNTAQKFYNSTIGSSFYQEKLRPIVDIALGGTLRLFIQHVYNGSYWSDKDETVIKVYLEMPNGSTIMQSDFVISKMEAYLGQFSEIKQFETNIQSRGAIIKIYFTKENQTSSFPYNLKNKLISKAVTYGAGSWSVVGIGDGFNNNIKENNGSRKIKMTGYNYDDLYAYAKQLRNNLLSYRRIKEVNIDYKFSSKKTDYRDFCFDLRKRDIADAGLYPRKLYSAVGDMFMSDSYLGYINGDAGYSNIYLSSDCFNSYDIWHLKKMPLNFVRTRNNKSFNGNSAFGRVAYKVSDFADISKVQDPQKIAKNNQQYILCLQYNYIGGYDLAIDILDENVEKISSCLPLGYKCEKISNGHKWGSSENRQYLLILLIIVIIYFTTSILFNSLSKPFLIISIIPISFVGIFITFYWFDLNFDQGGFTAFIMLCGLTVNASIYIVNEYVNVVRKHSYVKFVDGKSYSVCRLSRLDALIKAVNAKIIPIFLTVISTIIGFVPFMIGEKEGFWFPLAAGTIGGLVMSLIGIFLFLPAFMKLDKRKNV